MKWKLVVVIGVFCIFVFRVIFNKMIVDCVMERKKKFEDDKVIGVILVNWLLIIW